jgi:hypothetical protein
MDEVVDQELGVPVGLDGDPNDILLNFVLERWLGIATVAWDGFSTKGRGVVCLTEGDGPLTLAYRKGSPCPCHQEMVEGYDPNRQVVIAHCTAADDIRSINVFGGWPLPPDAASSSSAADCQATIH